jgi:hypothetical protein
VAAGLSLISVVPAGLFAVGIAFPGLCPGLFSVVPVGLFAVGTAFPGLLSWAIFVRPCGTVLGWSSYFALRGRQRVEKLFALRGRQAGSPGCAGITILCCGQQFFFADNSFLLRMTICVASHDLFSDEISSNGRLALTESEG